MIQIILASENQTQASPIARITAIDALLAESKPLGGNSSPERNLVGPLEQILPVIVVGGGLKIGGTINY